MIKLAAPEIGDEEIAAVTAVLRSGYLVQGQQVSAFEQALAAYVGVEQAVAVSSGTAALHLALLALGIGPGDEVIVPDFTFPATANVVALTGARLVLVDIGPRSYNIDVAQIRRALTSRTRAIMPVHLFGQPADMAPILELARDHSLRVVEDAACALGADYHGHRCGSLGDAACFSFHPRKAITTGEGGVVVTHDVELAARVRCWRNHGIMPADGRPQITLAGFNYRMTDLQAALGRAQMRRLESIIARRAELAAGYDEALAGVPGLVRPSIPAGLRHAWQAYVVLIDEAGRRDELIAWLASQGIETSIGTYAVSLQPHYRAAAGPLPNSQRAYWQSLALPLHTGMSREDVAEVARQLARGLSRTRA